MTYSTPNQLAWKKFKTNYLALGGLLYLAIMLLIAIIAPYIVPDQSPHANTICLPIATQKPIFTVQSFVYTKNEVDYTIPIYKYHTTSDSIHIEEYTGNTPNEGLIRKIAFNSIPNFNLEKAIQSKSFYFGTDRLGRDLFSRMLLGTRISLTIGLIAVFISLLIGVVLGGIGGYYGGWVDTCVTWLINVVWSIPTLILVIAITFVLGKGFWQVFVGVGLTMWVEIARMTRGQILSLREKEYIEACKSMGYSDIRILLQHLLPNITGPLIVISASNFASAILIEAGLSFLGIGVQPPIPTWGSMIKEHYSYIMMDAAYLAFIPGLAIMLLVMAFIFVGDGLRDTFDYRKTD